MATEKAERYLDKVFLVSTTVDTANQSCGKVTYDSFEIGQEGGFHFKGTSVLFFSSPGLRNNPRNAR